MTASTAPAVRPVAVKEQRVPRLRQAWLPGYRSQAGRLAARHRERAHLGAPGSWAGAIRGHTVPNIPSFLAAPRGGTHCSSPCDGSNAWRLRVPVAPCMQRVERHEPSWIMWVNDNGAHPPDSVVNQAANSSIDRSRYDCSIIGFFAIKRLRKAPSCLPSAGAATHSLGEVLRPHSSGG